MKDRWVQAEVNDLLRRRGKKTYSKPEADRALGLTIDFFKKHLKGWRGARQTTVRRKLSV